MAKSFPNTGATVIDTSADLPTASAALEGVMMFQKDTNELKICDGASWISMLDTDVPPAMSVIYSGTFSASTAVNIDSIFTSAYANYRIVFSAYHTAIAGTMNVNIQMRTAGTTYSGATYDYGAHSTFADGTASLTGANTGSSLVGAVQSNGTNAGTNHGYTSIDVYAPNLATWTSTFNNRMAFNQPPNQFYGGYYVGQVRQTTQYDGISFTSANAMTGAIRVYGYRNSI